MAVEHIFSGEAAWRPEPAKAAGRLGVDAMHMRAFEGMLECAGTVWRPGFVAGELQIEALGDDFALVSGEWMEGAFLASTIAAAQKAYAFIAAAGSPEVGADSAEVRISHESPLRRDISEFAPQMEPSWTAGLDELACLEAVERLFAAIPRLAGEEFRVFSPLSGHGWPDAWTESILRLLDTEPLAAVLTDKGELPRGSLPGFLLVLKPARNCRAHCAGGNCGGCGAAQMQ